MIKLQYILLITLLNISFGLLIGMDNTNTSQKQNIDITQQGVDVSDLMNSVKPFPLSDCTWKIIYPSPAIFDDFINSKTLNIPLMCTTRTGYITTGYYICEDKTGEWWSMTIKKGKVKAISIASPKHETPPNLFTEFLQQAGIRYDYDSMRILQKESAITHNVPDVLHNFSINNYITSACVAALVIAAGYALKKYYSSDNDDDEAEHIDEEYEDNSTEEVKTNS